MAVNSAFPLYFYSPLGLGPFLFLSWLALHSVWGFTNGLFPRSLKRAPCGSTTPCRRCWVRRVSSSRPSVPRKRWSSSRAATPPSRSLDHRSLLSKRRQKKKCRKPVSSGQDAGEAAQWTWVYSQNPCKMKKPGMPCASNPRAGDTGTGGS